MTRSPSSGTLSGNAGTDAVADALVIGYRSSDARLHHIGAYELPSTDEVARVIEIVRALLFPGYVGPSMATVTGDALRDVIRDQVVELGHVLGRQVYRALHHTQQLAKGGNEPDCSDCAITADEITQRFLARLPALRAAVALDVQAAYEGDPAATGIDEVILSYPGTYAITVYRVAHALLAEGAVVIPRVMTELAHVRTGIDIHPGATIGPSFFIDHGTGVVIGETTQIGARVRVYQGVTLGAMSVPYGADRPPPGKRRHPTIEDGVVIYAGATILGGDTVIGQGAVIGGNAWVTTSVAPGARVAGAHARRDPAP